MPVNAILEVDVRSVWLVLPFINFDQTLVDVFIILLAHLDKRRCWIIFHVNISIARTY